MAEVPEILPENKQNISQSVRKWLIDHDKFSKSFLIFALLFTLLITISISLIDTAHLSLRSYASIDPSKKVVVYGGTPAGVLAAVTAARAGASVILLEPTQHVGGIVSNGLDATDYGNRNTIGGYTKEFFNRTQVASGTSDGRYHFEAHVAENVFNDMLKSTNVQVFLGQQLAEQGGVVKMGTTITSIKMASGLQIPGSIFIDASYEGDLMAQSGVKYSVGREAISEYNESLAGVQPGKGIISLPPIVPSFLTTPPGATGTADLGIQDSNYRICISSDSANIVPFPKPANYNPNNYSLVIPYLTAKSNSTRLPAQLSWVIYPFPLAHKEFDTNSSGPISTAPTGTNWAYPNGSYAQRKDIVDWHTNYDQGLLIMEIGHVNYI
jgi:hypothetical protein